MLQLIMYTFSEKRLKRVEDINSIYVLYILEYIESTNVKSLINGLLNVVLARSFYISVSEMEEASS